MSPYLAKTLRRAAEYADAQAHREVTLEHALLALTEDPEASIILKSSNIDLDRLHGDVSNFLGNVPERQHANQPQPIVVSSDLRRILETAAEAASQGRRGEMNGAILLAAIIGDGRSNAAHFLSSQGLTFEDVIDKLRQHVASSAQRGHAAPPPQAAPTTAPGVHPPAAARPSDGPPIAHSTEEVLASARQKVGDRRSDVRAPAASGAPAMSSGTGPRGPGAVGPAMRAASPPVPNPQPPAAEPPRAMQPRQASFEDGSAARSIEPQWQPVTAPSGEREAVRSQSQQPERRPPPSHRVPPPVSPNAGLAPPPVPRSEPEGRSQPGAGTGSGPVPSRPIAAPPQLTRSTGMPLPNMPPAPWSEGDAAGRPRGPGQGPQGHHPLVAGQQPVRPSGLPSGPVAGQRPQAAGPSARSTRMDIEHGALENRVPERMKVGVGRLAEVRLARSGVKALSEGLNASSSLSRGDSQFVTKALSVKLRSPDSTFWVEAASPETLWIENVLGVMTDEYVSWRWHVTPKVRGAQRLQLIVSARTVGTDGLAAETALPDRLFEVRVQPNYRDGFKRLSGWIVAMGIGAAMAWFSKPALVFLKDALNRFLTSANW